MWFKDKKMTGKQQLKAGDTVVIYGRTNFERELVTYTDAKELVSYIREKDYPDDEMNNQEYMQMILKNIQSYNEGFTMPTHNEEAFVAALFRLGLCDKTQLN
jgi:hypothetical protein